MFYYSYRIENLVVEEKYKINLKMSVCFEAQGSCEIEVQILNNTEVNKPTCNWANGFLNSCKYTHFDSLVVILF